MGTTISLLLPEKQAGLGMQIVRSLFTEWEQILSRFLPESELSQLNQHPGTPTAVSHLLYAVLATALSAAQATQGVYDPAMLDQLVQLGYDRTFDDLPAVRPGFLFPGEPGGGWRGIRVNPLSRYVTLPVGVKLDFGGIAKGMAVDAALEQLRLSGVSSALVNAGGDLAVLGLPPIGVNFTKNRPLVRRGEGGWERWGGPLWSPVSGAARSSTLMGLPPTEEHWQVAVPGRGRFWTIPLHHGAVATSGIAHRHWWQGNTLRHHLLDPRTGLPAQSDLWSVTVVADRCEQAEVAAKVAFILGSKPGAYFLSRHRIAGLLVREDGTWEAVEPWPAHLMEEEQS